jgi:hypothetical protein
MEEFTYTVKQTIARLADICPRCLSTYILIIENLNEKDEVEFTREDIINNYARSWTKLKNDIRTLASFNILSFCDKGTILQVEMSE